MTPDIQLNATATSTLATLQRIFSSHANVSVVQANTPSIIEEFRRRRTADELELGNPLKPEVDFVFAAECGTAQDGARTFALIFTQLDRLQQFFAENPSLNGTLVTCWNGVAAVWLRATGRVPRDFAADGAHWCSSGTIPVGSPKQLSDTFHSPEGQIKLVDFSQIVWNEPQRAELETIYLEMEIGAPFRTGPRGRRVLNLAYWAKTFTGMIRVTYDPDRNLFTWADTTAAISKVLNEDDTLREYTRLLEIAAPTFGGRFPQGEIRPARVRQLVARIKVLTQQTRESDDELLEAFVNKQLERTPGKDLASHEAWAAFIQFRQALGRPPCPVPWFYRNLLLKIRSIYGVAQRHDLTRNEKRVRGYGGLTLKEVSHVKAADVSDPSDAPDGPDGA